MSITCKFGYRIHPVTGGNDYHLGIDLRARSEPVFSILDGKVSSTGYNKILGKYIRISHEGIESVYGHLSTVLVGTGEEVYSGRLIGVTGATGRVTGEHLHFAIKCDSIYLDPVVFFLYYLELNQQ